MSDTALVLAGRIIPDPADRIRRYCGLPWSGGTPETWAFRYYDAVPSADPDRIDPVDVMVTAALHPGFSRTDLAYFTEEAGKLEAWLRSIPSDVDLADAGDDLVDYVAGLSTWDAPVGLSLRSKVLHRKRPQLVPLFDRAVVDWYRPVTGERAAASAWAPLLRALRDDLALADSRAAIEEISAQVQGALEGPVPSPLRLADIVVWMGVHG